MKTEEDPEEHRPTKMKKEKRNDDGRGGVHPTEGYGETTTIAQKHSSTFSTIFTFFTVSRIHFDSPSSFQFQPRGASQSSSSDGSRDDGRPLALAPSSACRALCPCPGLGLGPVPCPSPSLVLRVAARGRRPLVRLLLLLRSRGPTTTPPRLRLDSDRLPFPSAISRAVQDAAAGE